MAGERAYSRLSLTLGSHQSEMRFARGRSGQPSIATSHSSCEALETTQLVDWCTHYLSNGRFISQMSALLMERIARMTAPKRLSRHRFRCPPTHRRVQCSETGDLGFGCLIVLAVAVADVHGPGRCDSSNWNLGATLK